MHLDLCCLKNKIKHSQIWYQKNTNFLIVERRPMFFLNMSACFTRPERGILKFPTMMPGLSISPSISVNFFVINFEVILLVSWKFMIVLSFWWIDPFATMKCFLKIKISDFALRSILYDIPCHLSLSRFLLSTFLYLNCVSCKQCIVSFYFSTQKIFMY